MTAETRSLHKKLAEVMAEAERIPKNGTAPQAMGGFKFVQVGDAADFIRVALGKRHVSMLPTQVEIVGQTEHATKSGGTMTTAELRITWTLTDGESGESTTFQSYGVGADTGDKYSGKATTTAMKYALLSGFQLSTGDDVEQTDTSDRQARQESRRPTRMPSAADALHDPETGGLIGVVEARGQDDFELRQEATRGWALPFRLTEGRDSVKVVAFGRIAQAISTVKTQVLGKRVTVWGTFKPRSFTKTEANGSKKKVEYQVLELERIATSDWILPADEIVDAPHADDESEPESVAAFSDEELAGVEA